MVGIMLETEFQNAEINDENISLYWKISKMLFFIGPIVYEGKWKIWRVVNWRISH